MPPSRIDVDLLQDFLFCYSDLDLLNDMVMIYSDALAELMTRWDSIEPWLVS